MRQGGKLRILFVLPYVPSPIRVRPYQFVRHLARLGHAVTLVALDDGLPRGEALAELRDACEAVHVVPHARWRGAAQCLLSLPTPTPLWAAYCRSGEMARLLQQLVRDGDFDVAHVEHLRAAHFANALRPLPAVFDAVDCITALRRQMLGQPGPAVTRLLSFEEWVKLRRYEPRVYRPYRRVVVTSQHDADELRKLDEQLPVHVLPNGVDLEYFRPSEVAPEPDTLVFSGKMSYHANEDAAKYLANDVLPRLRARRPGVKVTIVGSGPSPSLQALASREAGVTVTGYVDDLRPYLGRALAAVCPMRVGMGIQNKALEAMAVARPVVCSPLVSRSLGGAQADGALRVADGPDAFAEACAGLLARPDEAREAGAAARRYVEQHHRWAHAAGALVALYEEARREAGRRG